MSSGSAREAQRLAEQQSRHLDSIASMTLGITVLMSSGGAAFVGATDALSVNPLHAVSIFAPLLSAFVFTLYAVGQRTLLIPEPRADSELISRRMIGTLSDRELRCLIDTIRGNRIRSVALLAARLSILVAVANFVYWVTEGDLVEPSSVAESLFLMAPEPQQEAAKDVSSEERERAVIGWCQQAFPLAPDEESAAILELCTREKLTSRLWMSTNVAMATLASLVAFFGWTIANRRGREVRHAVRLGVLIDLEHMAHPAPRDSPRCCAAQLCLLCRRLKERVATIVKGDQGNPCVCAAGLRMPRSKRARRSSRFVDL